MQVNDKMHGFLLKETKEVPEIASQCFLFEHEKSDDVPYRFWNQQGLLTLTSGLYGIKTDYKKIIVELKELILLLSLITRQI